MAHSPLPSCIKVINAHMCAKGQQFSVSVALCGDKFLNKPASLSLLTLLSLQCLLLDLERDKQAMTVDF